MASELSTTSSIVLPPTLAPLTLSRGPVPSSLPPYSSRATFAPWLAASPNGANGPSSVDSRPILIVPLPLLAAELAADAAALVAAAESSEDPQAASDIAAASASTASSAVMRRLAPPVGFSMGLPSSSSVAARRRALACSSLIAGRLHRRRLRPPARPPRRRSPALSQMPEIPPGESSRIPMKISPITVLNRAV